MKPVVQVNLVSSQPWVELLFISYEAKYDKKKKKNASVLIEGRMELTSLDWKICNSEHVRYTEFSTRCQSSWRTHETFESEAGALASVVLAELSKSFLTDQWPDPSPLKYALTYLEWVKDTSPHLNLTTASSGSLTDWSVHYIDLPGRANIFVHKMQRGWLSIDGRREDHETS